MGIQASGAASAGWITGPEVMVGTAPDAWLAIAAMPTAKQADKQDIPFVRGFLMFIESGTSDPVLEC